MKRLCNHAVFMLNFVCALVTIGLVALVIAEAEAVLKNKTPAVTSTAVAVVR